MDEKLAESDFSQFIRCSQNEIFKQINVYDDKQHYLGEQQATVSKNQLTRWNGTMGIFEKWSRLVNIVKSGGRIGDFADFMTIWLKSIMVLEDSAGKREKRLSRF